MSINWRGIDYLQFTEEPMDGVLAHSVDLASVQCNPCIRLAVLSRYFLQAHQALPSLQQNAQDDESGLHVSLMQTHACDTLFTPLMLIKTLRFTAN